MASREIKDLVTELQREGWRVERTRNNHPRAYPPTGEGFVTFASTPRDRRSLPNTIAALRRRGFVWKGR
jgi:hypothetical protein